MIASTNHTIESQSHCHGYGRSSIGSVWTSAVRQERRVVYFPIMRWRQQYQATHGFVSVRRLVSTASWTCSPLVQTKHAQRPTKLTLTLSTTATTVTMNSKAWNGLRSPIILYKQADECRRAAVTALALPSPSGDYSLRVQWMPAICHWQLVASSRGRWSFPDKPRLTQRVPAIGAGTAHVQHGKDHQ